jgi:hypothetical protein
MAIPESQLDTWSHQGSITQSSSTYLTIKNALEANDSTYTNKNYKVFLQGSYGNDTNIYSESDVDIIIRLDSIFRHDLENLPQNQKDAFQKAFEDSTYSCKQFKTEVSAQLISKFGSSTRLRGKAIKIDAFGSRRSADVVAAAKFRRYHKFLSVNDQNYDEGIYFFNAQGEIILNYPQQHSQNCTNKNKATNSWFKPMVRILKNMRSKLVDEKIIESSTSPSYYIEGLLFNVPNEKFGSNYVDTFVNSINWIYDQDRSKFVCANEQYYLLYKDSNTSWDPSNCDEFLNAVVELWKQW